MRVRDVLLVLAGLGAAVLVARQIPADRAGRDLIESNEQACSSAAPRGFAGYPVTRMGELRGCLFVDKANPEHYRVMRWASM